MTIEKTNTSRVAPAEFVEAPKELMEPRSILPEFFLVTARLRITHHQLKDGPLNRKSSLILLSLFLILALTPFQGVKGFGGKTLTAPTASSVTIDGTFQAGEWADAKQLSDPWTSNNGSLTSNKVQLWTKTNGTDLLIAVGAIGTLSVNSGADTYNYTLSLLFDNNNNGVIDNNENAKSLGMTFSSPTTFTQTYRDLHYNSATGSYVNSASQLGAAAGTHTTSGSWSWEFAMPLSSSDFTLAQNASIGMDIVYSEQHYSSSVLASSGWAYWQESYSTGFPTGPLPSADPWASIYWTNLNAPIVDNTPPTIGTPSIKPSAPGPSDTVTVSVNVTDDSSVKNVSITYTTDNWKAVNKTLVATYNGTTHIATAQIPPLQFGGHVEYYITAFDSAGLKATNNNAGSYFGYDVSAPWFQSTWLYIVVGALIAMVVLFAIIYPKRHRRAANQTLPSQA